MGVYRGWDSFLLKYDGEVFLERRSIFCSGDLTSHILLYTNFNWPTENSLLRQDPFLCHNISVTRRGNCMPSSILKQCVVYQRKHIHTLLCLLDERSSLHNKMPEPKFEVNLHFIFHAEVQAFSV